MTTFYCVPERLIMRAAKCRYCPAEHDWDIQAGDQEGIRTCAAHKPAAERDCNAHFHQNNMVRLRDARAALAEFFDAVPETFPVIRSSGELDPGWHIPFDSYPEYYIAKIRGVDWGIPVIKGSGEDAITKAFRLTDFVKLRLGIAVETIQRSLAILDAGVYKADADAQNKIGVMTPTEPDIPYMRLVQLPTGEIIRGFIPPLSS
jgi:hypothetical protein